MIEVKIADVGKTRIGEVQISQRVRHLKKITEVGGVKSHQHLKSTVTILNRHVKTGDRNKKLE